MRLCRRSVRYGSAVSGAVPVIFGGCASSYGGVALDKTSPITERRSLSALGGGEAAFDADEGQTSNSFARPGILIEISMSMMKLIFFACTVTLIFSSPLFAQQLPREQWGAPAVKVSHADGKWIIAGQKNKATSARRSTTARFGFSRFKGFSVNR